MRILLDECVDPRVKQLFTDHAVFTVYEKGWKSLDDRALLRAAQEEFDVLLTIDRNLEFQQNLAELRIAVVVIHVPKNQVVHYAALLPEIRDAIDKACAGTAVHVPRRDAS